MHLWISIYKSKCNRKGNLGQTIVRPILSVIPGHIVAAVDRGILGHFDLSSAAYTNDEGNILNVN